jgi:ribosomal-protein-alanine N-acetyltransferase
MANAWSEMAVPADRFATARGIGHAAPRAPAPVGLLARAVPAAQAMPHYIRDKVAKTTAERLAEQAAVAAPRSPCMSAVFKSVEAELEPLTEERLDAVLAIEQTAYAHPWTRGNFQDSLRSGYQTQLLVADGELLGYVVAMKGVDEVHLLNITVAPAWQGQGWGAGPAGRIGHLVARPGGPMAVAGSACEQLACPCRFTSGTATAVLAPARATTPDGPGRREDAIVMSLRL